MSKRKVAITRTWSEDGQEQQRVAVPGLGTVEVPLAVVILADESSPIRVHATLPADAGEVCVVTFMTPVEECVRYKGLEPVEWRTRLKQVYEVQQVTGEGLADPLVAWTPRQALVMWAELLRRLCAPPVGSIRD